jgi:hypothetical protein
VLWRSSIRHPKTKPTSRTFLVLLPNRKNTATARYGIVRNRSGGRNGKIIGGPPSAMGMNRRRMRVSPNNLRWARCANQRMPNKKLEETIKRSEVYLQAAA